MKIGHPAPICRHHPARTLLALLTLAGVSVFSAHAEIPLLPPEAPTVATASSDPATRKPDLLSSTRTRWRTSLDAFARDDGERFPGDDGVLFVGSSTIRLWGQLSHDFSKAPIIINRGFGGSTMSDCSALVRELVIQYKPKEVLVYAGDNDLAQGRTPAEVLQSFVNFVRSVRAALPGTHIAYISIKPSPVRSALLSKVRETNALIADYVRTVPELRYINVFDAMLSADGLPNPELFRVDQLHLNEAGYRLWQSVIAAHLFAPSVPAPRSDQHPPQDQQVPGVGL